MASASFTAFSAMPLSVHALSQTSSVAKSTLAVRFSGLKDHRGKLVISVYDSPEHYRKHPLQVLRVPTETAAKQGISLSLPHGTYAISVYQDANNNGKIDRNLIGIPTELGGFSNNPRIVMGPPSFKSCAFRFSADQQLNIRLH